MERQAADLSVRPRAWTADYGVPAAIAAVQLALFLLVISRYGYFRDELYYLACAGRPAWGYVDHPAFSILALKALRALLGDSLFAIRLVPALLGAAVTFLTGVLARELGGGRFAAGLAALTGACRLGMGPLFHFTSMNAWDHVFWLACLFALVRLLKTRDPKHWLSFGLAAGLGFENKIAVLFLAFGVAVGLVATRDRALLRGKRFWTGTALAAALALPYLLWNAAHGWPTAAFLRYVGTVKNPSVSPLGFLHGQVLLNGPATALVWATGLGFLLFHREGKRFRSLGVAYLAIFALFLFTRAKDYYLAPFYPVLVAAGAVAWERLRVRKGGRVLTAVLPAALLLLTAPLLPLTLPLLRADGAAAYFEKLGVKPRDESHELGPLPQYWADMFGWEELTALVVKAADSLTPDERARSAIFVRNYGEAAALEFFGRRYGLPPVFCGHNNYWFWGPPGDGVQAYIIMGDKSDLQANLADLGQYFGSVELAGATFHKYAMPYENGRQIFVCRKAKTSLRAIWDRTKHFE